MHHWVIKELLFFSLGRTVGSEFQHTEGLIMEKDSKVIFEEDTYLRYESGLIILRALWHETHVSVADQMYDWVMPS